MRLIIDAHLDLAMNVVHSDRDLTQELDVVRGQESHMTDELYRGRATTTLPEMRRGGIGTCIATLVGRSGPTYERPAAHRRTDIDFATRMGAHANAHAQLACYRLLEQQGQVRLIRTARELDEHWQSWQQPAGDALPIGIILSMEGADSIVAPEQAEQWWDQGLRAVGPVHYGHSHYAAGTGVTGPLTPDGVKLLGEFERLGMLLDVTHMCDQSMAHALEIYAGPVLASHHNCRELVPGDRQLTDDQIKLLIDRDAVIGAAMDNWMLYPGWQRGKTSPEVVGLDDVANHIDHVCQLAGNTNHSAIGSDLDGGYGTEQTPRDVDSIADMQVLDGVLAARGYDDEARDRIFHGNWLRLFRRTLPSGKNDK